MKRKLAVSAALAFLLCSVLGQAQEAPAKLVAVKTPGGTVNAVAKFTATNIIGNSAISETGGNVTVTGSITAGGPVSGSGISTGGTVSGDTGSFSRNISAENVFLSVGIIADGFISAGTSSLNGSALGGENNSTSQTLELTNKAAPSGSNFIEAQFNATKATFFTDTKGDTTAIGTKSAAVPLTDGSMVKVFSVEAPEVMFEDYGSGQLNAGLVSVSVEEKFAQTVNLSKGYYVFLSPKGDCKGLYVTNETDAGFEVREMSGGASSVAFDYHIVAYRNGYENVRLPAAIMPTLAAAPSK